MAEQHTPNVKWCRHCIKANHSDEECWSTRALFSAEPMSPLADDCVYRRIAARWVTPENAGRAAIAAEISRLTAELPPVIGLTENAEEIAKRFDPLILAKWYLQAEYWRKHWHREMMLHAERIHNQRAEIGRLTAELEEARKDAARYRWLLNNYARGDGYTAIDAALNDGEPDSQLSQAIDAAMTKEKL